MIARLFLVLLFPLLFLEAKEKPASLDYLNTLRQDAGLGELSLNISLKKAAKAHARYSLRVQKYAHYERPGRKGFEGLTPSDRAVYAGYLSREVMENIAVNTFTPKSTIDNLLSAIYHRFVFLSFDADEIGEGRARTVKKRTIQDVHVYDLGSKALNKMCQKEYLLHTGMYYLTDLCKEKSKRIPQETYEYLKRSVWKKSAKVILYPFSGQKGVLPAFFNETPDPLPGYKVSGFPISVQFNPYYFYKVRLLDFSLYDSSGKKLSGKILTHLSDPNHKLKPYEFALLPLKRLEYAQRYKVYFEALADGKKIIKEWYFTTRKPQGRFFRITREKSRITIGKSRMLVIYFVPKNRKDILKKVQHTPGLKVRFIDQNTIEVKLPSRRPKGGFRVKSAYREVRF